MIVLPRKLPLLLSWCLFSAAIAKGQEVVREYGFIAPTLANTQATTASATFGILPPSTPLTPTSTGTSAQYGGGLGVVWRFGHTDLPHHFGAGFDLSAVVPAAGKVGSETVASLGLNGYFHPLSNTNFDPYLTGGYAGLFRDFGANGFNGGVGFNYWLGGNWGLMFEARELVFSNSPSIPANRYTEFRIGVAHRSQ